MACFFLLRNGFSKWNNVLLLKKECKLTLKKYFFDIDLGVLIVIIYTHSFETTKVTSGEIAQLVEQGTENPRVGGPIPSLATIFLSFFNAKKKL